jgi:hypothetical protein
VVRETLSGVVVAKVVAAAIAQALVAGAPMPPPDAAMPKDTQKAIADYRRCEASFKSALAAPRGADAAEQAIYDKRVGVERVVACLFQRKDSAKVAADFALDADFDHSAAFVDDLMRDLSVPWLAPYLNLIGGHAKLCEEPPADATRQLTAARNEGPPLVRIAADYLLSSGECLEK